jgi:hypothetical protein
MGAFYANAGPINGAMSYREATRPGARPIGVFAGPGDVRPIGSAICIGSNGLGMARWRLVVDGAAMAGEWWLIDRQFRPAQGRRPKGWVTPDPRCGPTDDPGSSARSR